MLFRRYTSPIGCLLIAAERDTLTHCLWEDATDAALTAHWTEDRALQCRLLTEASRQLEEYFSGARKTFDLPIQLNGTPFQQLVWRTLAQIPYGETAAYAELARRMGSRRAARAVGNANRHNPLMVILPCHRVVGSNGKTGGYAGGTDRKIWLLEHERGSDSRLTATAELPMKRA